MREIKFRAWDDISYMSNPFTLLDLQTDKIGFTSNCKIMQYTGLKDKNGKEIYEGDILDCQDRIVKIVWHNEAGCFDAKFIKYQFNLCSNGCTNQEFKYRAIVIGNIYENPELINQQN